MIAPSLSVKLGAKTFSSLIFKSEPKPLHISHAPCGELNENKRGSISGSEIPQKLHANFSLNKRSVNFWGLVAKSSDASSIKEIITKPSASLRDSSTDCDKRLRKVLRSASSFKSFLSADRRSITTSMVCLLVLMSEK